MKRILFFLGRLLAALPYIIALLLIILGILAIIWLVGQIP